MIALAKILNQKTIPSKAALLILCFSVPAFGQAKPPESPTAMEVVTQFQLLLVDVMKRGDVLGFEGRNKALDQAVRTSHAVSTISRIVLGKRWKALGAEQQKQFMDVFTRLIVATYAHNFKSYSGEKFEFISEKETARGGKVIRTVFIESSGNEIQFDYLMKKQGARWLIVNIIADGVSDLAVKRSDYANLLAREGFEALLNKLEEKVERYAQAGN